MKLVKAKTTRRFGGEPYITLPRGSKISESIDEMSSSVLIGKGIYKILKEGGYNSIAEVPETFEYAETLEASTVTVTRIGFDTIGKLTKGEGGSSLTGQHAGVSISCDVLMCVDGLEDVDAYYLSLETTYGVPEES